MILSYGGIIKYVDGFVSDFGATAEIAMKSAIYFGLTRPDTTVAQLTDYTCPSGNCTWDPFQSLAVCSACTDLSDRLDRLDLYESTDGDGSVCFADVKDVKDVKDFGDHRYTEYRLPNALGLQGSNYYGSSPAMIGSGTNNKSYSISLGSKDTLIWSITLIRIADPKTKWPNSSVTAAECGLWYCVRNYSSKVENGKLIEVSSHASSTRSPADFWQNGRIQVDGFEWPRYRLAA